MGGLVSGLTGSAKKARRAQTNAAHDANVDMARTRDEIINRLKPQMELGDVGLEELGLRLGLTGESTDPLYGSLMKNFTGANLENDPGYQFGLGQGMQALDRQMAARGGLLSGAALKGGQRFAQDYAGTKFNEAYNRDATDKNRIANFLGNVANIGINATGAANQAQMTASQQYAQNTIGAGNALAAQHIAQGKGWDSLANTGLTLAGTGLAMGLGGAGGLSSLFGGTAPGFTGGVTSTGAMTGFSQNVLNPNPNFAKWAGLG